MKIRRISAGIALVATGALALSACSNSPSDSNASTAPSASAASGGTVTVAEVNGFSSFNSSTGTGNSDINSKVALVTGSHFYYIDGDLKVQHDKSFGTEEIVKQDPLTVKYTINKGKTWSDGEPITADDLMLAWAVFSGHYNDAATTYFDYAGDTTGLGLTDLPVIGDDNESITMTYSQPFADWETAFDLDKPAHILAKKAGLADAAALTKLFQDTPKGDPAASAAPNAELQKVADFYNTGWDTTTFPTDPDLVVSSGPWIVKDIVDGQSITLDHNPKYSGDQKPKIDELVIRTIGDAQSMVQALQNGEVDVVAPQASADTLSALSALQGVTVQKGNQLSYDHLDLNFSGVFADPKVREAFMKTVPRQAILDAIITPLDPKAKPLDSQLFVPQQDAYADVIKTNTSADFGKVDIEGAKTLLAGATPTVRLMYNKDNPNRVDAYTLIAASAKEAGFNIVDGGLPKTEWSLLSATARTTPRSSVGSTRVSACPASRRSSRPLPATTSTASATRTPTR